MAKDKPTPPVSNREHFGPEPVTQVTKKEHVGPVAGPYLAAAVIAERIIADSSDNVNSLIRLVDRVGIDPDEFKEAKKGDLVGFRPLHLFISFRTGGFNGRAKATLVQTNPSGEREQIGMAEITFNGTQTDAFNLKSDLIAKWDGLGTYWLDVVLDDKVCTRIPFTLVPQAEVNQGNTREA